MDKELLKSVLVDYQLEIPRHEVLPRNFRFEEFGNYVFVGIRRAGKSYILYQRIQQLLNSGIGWDEILYINFEDERLGNITAQDLNLLLEIHMEMYGKRPILFLDEIQNIDGWEKFARRLADSKYRVYITGSNAKMLSKEIQSTLGGRYIPVDIYPYSFNEFLAAKNIKLLPTTLYGTETKAEVIRLFNDYFRFGGFPEGAALSSKRDYLSSLYQKIYLGDIAARHAIENTFALKIMFKKIAESIMQPLSFSRLTNIITATGIKVGKNTIINYLEYAKEALVAISLLRKYGREDAVFFYNQGVEVDFYIPECETAIQVSYTISDQDTLEREAKALVKLSSFMPCNRLLIITKDEEKTINIDGKEIKVTPIWKWLLNEL